MASSSGSHPPTIAPSGPAPVPIDCAPATSGFTLSVRFDGSEPDLALVAGPEERTSDVVRRIKVNRPHLERRRLRLVHMGRVLTEGVRLLPWIESYQARQPTARTSPAASAKGKGSARDAARHIWLNCSIGDESDESDADAVQQPQLAPLRGFDRLREAGIAESDIEDMRRAFHERRGGDDADDEHARALEDAWVDAGASADDPLPEGGAYNVLLQGVVLGFGASIMPFYFFRTALFSRRMQMAIVLGLVTNLAFGGLRYVQ